MSEPPPIQNYLGENPYCCAQNCAREGLERRPPCTLPASFQSSHRNPIKTNVGLCPSEKRKTAENPLIPGGLACCASVSYARVRFQRSPTELAPHDKHLQYTEHWSLVHFARNLVVGYFDAT